MEVCLGQRWGIVGNDGWTEVNSHVICNALGYDFTGMHTQVTISNTYSFPFKRNTCFFVYYSQINRLTKQYLKPYQNQSTYTPLFAQEETWHCWSVVLLDILET